jgi:hypothetical protein
MCELTELCAREFEEHVDRLAAAHKRGRIVVSSPICTQLAVVIADIPKLKRLVRAALRARAWFCRQGPAWAQPLPLNEIEREKLYCSGYFHQHLLGCYSESLQARDFDYLNHPLLFDYARGMLAAGVVGEAGLLADAEVLAEFPPRPLPGLDAQGRWHPLPNRASRLLELNLSGLSG